MVLGKRLSGRKLEERGARKRRGEERGATMGL